MGMAHAVHRDATSLIHLFEIIFQMPQRRLHRGIKAVLIPVNKRVRIV